MGQKAGFDGDGVVWKVFRQCGGENEQKKKECFSGLGVVTRLEDWGGCGRGVGLTCRAGTGSLNSMEGNRSHLYHREITLRQGSVWMGQMLTKLENLCQ